MNRPYFAVDPMTGCWIWQRAKNSKGYGQLRLGVGRRNSKTFYVHRLVFEAFVGPIPAGYEIDHVCFNRPCANPAHLEAVTPAENMRRMGARHLTCKHGHRWTSENTYLRKDTGSRQCRACHRQREARTARA